jgi:hypothetical protein
VYNILTVCTCTFATMGEESKREDGNCNHNDVLTVLCAIGFLLSSKPVYPSMLNRQFFVFFMKYLSLFPVVDPDTTNNYVFDKGDAYMFPTTKTSANSETRQFMKFIRLYVSLQTQSLILGASSKNSN